MKLGMIKQISNDKNPVDRTNVRIGRANPEQIGKMGIRSNDGSTGTSWQVHKNLQVQFPGLSAPASPTNLDTGSAVCPGNGSSSGYILIIQASDAGLGPDNYSAFLVRIYNHTPTILHSLKLFNVNSCNEKISFNQKVAELSNGHNPHWLTSRNGNWK